MSKRQKINLKTDLPATRSEFEAKVDRVAELQIQLQTAIAARDQAKEAVIAEREPAIKALESEIKRESTLCAAYAHTHWDELSPNGTRSGETPMATYSFRKGNPTLAKVGKVKEEVLAEQLHDAGRDEYLVLKYELNKERLKKAVQAKVEWALQLFKITQKDGFEIQAKAKK
ncbi:MAG: hypothetical protein E1N59_2856 [Puniceicoccaceae bacterium 5H]|nr:MAG: hypothetical protein E1N59_2856 [Puniceicoccaceae bacterium 5H]